MNRRLRAFTLIEMLIVIAIIAILLALILPAVGGARRRAETLKCASNLRQIGIAISSYGRDTGHYPLGFCGGAATTNQAMWGEWSYSLNGYLGGEPLPGWSDPGKRSPVIHCPAAPRRGRDLECNYSAHPGIMVDPGWDPPDRFPDDGVVYTMFKRPSDIVLVVDGLRKSDSSNADATFIKVDPYAVEAWNGNPADADKTMDPKDGSFAEHNSEDLSDGDHWPAWRHDNAMNTLRVDGHVELLKLVGPDGQCEFKEKHVRYNY
ncbi:MAG: prepilin-type N-terminal cleavage/methylation domain-containing protein [Verrucomicrobiota bacterium]